MFLGCYVFEATPRSVLCLDEAILFGRHWKKSGPFCFCNTVKPSLAVSYFKRTRINRCPDDFSIEILYLSSPVHGHLPSADSYQECLGFNAYSLTTYHLQSNLRVREIWRAIILCFSTDEDDIMVQFAIWERGDIGIDQLSSQLKLSLRHALCDLLTEYYLLTAPLSKVPEKYRKTQVTRLRSCSEPSSPSTLTPKGPAPGSFPQASETSSRRQLDFGGQLGFRSKTASLSGHRRTPSTSSTPSTGSPGRLI